MDALIDPLKQQALEWAKKEAQKMICSQNIMLIGLALGLIIWLRHK